MSATDAPVNFALEHDAWGKLVLAFPHGVRHTGVDPVRGFPITDPGGPVYFLDADGREVFAVPRLDGLPATLRERLEAELAQRHFLPVIRRVVRVTGHADPAECEAETDRGRVRFAVRGEDVRRLPGGRMLLTDTHGVRYLIPDVADLPAADRRHLARYL